MCTSTTIFALKCVRAQSTTADCVCFNEESNHFIVVIVFKLSMWKFLLREGAVRHVFDFKIWYSYCNREIPGTETISIVLVSGIIN